MTWYDLVWLGMTWYGLQDPGSLDVHECVFDSRSDSVQPFISVCV